MAQGIQQLLHTEAEARGLVAAARAEAESLLASARREASALRERARAEAEAEAAARLRAEEHCADEERTRRLMDERVRIDRALQVDPGRLRETVVRIVRCLRGDDPV